MRKYTFIFHIDNLPYEQTEGIVNGHAAGNIPSIPNFSTINRRVNRLDLIIENKNRK
jgi:hypothetical protein